MSSEFVTIRVVLAQPDPAEHDCLVPAVMQGGLDEVFGTDSANEEIENVEALRPRVR